MIHCGFLLTTKLCTVYSTMHSCSLPPVCEGIDLTFATPTPNALLGQNQFPDNRIIAAALTDSLTLLLSLYGPLDLPAL